MRPPEAEQELLDILRPGVSEGIHVWLADTGKGLGALSFNYGRRIVRRAAGTQKGGGSRWRRRGLCY